jgi:1-acyl-sn-glycerol-3-phosphate acyltransferase
MNDASTAPQNRAVPTHATQTPLYQIFRGLCRMAGTLLFDLKAYDVTNVPTTGGVLIVSNHQSFLDPAVLGIPIRRPVSFLAKSELFEGTSPLGRLFGKVIRRLNAFPVRQGEGDVGAVRETIKRLQEGRVLTMFPEGGRSSGEEIEPMQPGVGLIVRRAGPTVKVVPAAVDGSFRAWSRYRKLPRPAPVRVKYGEPMELAHLKSAQIIQAIEKEIRRLHGELRALH